MQKETGSKSSLRPSPGARRMARIDSVDVTGTGTGRNPAWFSILKSGTGSLTGMIPPDIAICDDCIADIFDAGGRYENYWATSCVNCGPRYSIIRELPYDRERTSMDEFPMCPDCAREYGDPHSRRHHAQTIASPECGPQLELFDNARPESRSASTRSKRQRNCSTSAGSSRSAASVVSTLSASKSPPVN